MRSVYYSDLTQCFNWPDVARRVWSRHGRQSLDWPRDVVIVRQTSTDLDVEHERPRRVSGRRRAETRRDRRRPWWTRVDRRRHLSAVRVHRRRRPAAGHRRRPGGHAPGGRSAGDRCPVRRSQCPRWLGERRQRPIHIEIYTDKMHVVSEIVRNNIRMCCDVAIRGEKNFSSRTTFSPQWLIVHCNKSCSRALHPFRHLEFSIYTHTYHLPAITNWAHHAATSVFSTNSLHHRSSCEPAAHWIW